MQKRVLMLLVVYFLPTSLSYLNEVTHRNTGPKSGLVLDIQSFYFILLLGDQSQSKFLFFPLLNFQVISDFCRF